MRNHADYSLMKSLYDSCRRDFDRAARGDLEKHALLAALAANGSGGYSKACLYSPTLHGALSGRLEGRRSSLPLAPRRDLERYLETFGTATGKETSLRRLASFHGSTLVAGFHCVRWGVSVDELLDDSTHFVLADRLIEEFCTKRDLKLERDLPALGHLWTAGRGLRDSRVSMYVGRLRMRFDIYRWILNQDVITQPNVTTAMSTSSGPRRPPSARQGQP